ncbi:hypothetical protein BGW42_000208 [Actinomortierella wolfii]|nr:hypothetical protein BGW42_000208 [Actinomortierella wolfii]
MSVLASPSPFIFPLGEPAKSYAASHVHPIAIQIPANALSYLSSFNEKSDLDEMQTPPLEPSSPCSSVASSPRFDSFIESVAAETRRRNREFFFPNMQTVESAAPVVTRASELTVDDGEVSYAEHQRRRLREFFFPNMTVESATPTVTRAADLKLSVDQTPQKQQKPAKATEQAAKNRRSREFFFPSLETFESVVPVVTRAADVKLKGHNSLSWGEHQRRQMKKRFFPSLSKFESAVPTVTRAADLKLSVDGRAGSASAATSAAATPPVATTPLAAPAAITNRGLSQSSGQPNKHGGWGEYHRRKASQDFFFPNLKFESAVPMVVRASEVNLGHEHRQHWQKQAEIDQLYHADSLKTVDGRRMFRLL